jgi:hypothetical protein
MTIITYRDGIIAADTLVVGGPEGTGFRVGYGPKLLRIKNGVLALCGRAAPISAIAEWLENGRDGELPPCPGGGAIWFPDHGRIEDIADNAIELIDFDAPYLAWGSGEQFALAAMWMGADAAKAAEAAMAFDVNCGGTITTMQHVR